MPPDPIPRATGMPPGGDAPVVRAEIQKEDGILFFYVRKTTDE